MKRESKNMSSGRLYPVIIIAGATASGKTRVAIDLARRIDAEIISADSRQIFQDMAVGTARPSAEELAAAKHHFVDTLPLQADYSAGAFSREARTVIHDLRQSGKNVVVAGGSGMYISALLDGFFEPVAQDKAFRKKLKQQAEKEGGDALYGQLQEIDPERAGQLSPNDLHRIIRALEVYHATGKTLSSLLIQPRIPADFPFAIFGLAWERKSLYRRIERRVDQMLEAGLENEVKMILQKGFSPKLNALQTVGYREIIQYFSGEMSFDEAVEKIKQHSRNFAKRQMTWFRKEGRLHWLDVDDQTISEAAERIWENVSSA